MGLPVRVNKNAFQIGRKGRRYRYLVFGIFYYNIYKKILWKYLNSNYVRIHFVIAVILRSIRIDDCSRRERNDRRFNGNIGVWCWKCVRRRFPF